MTFAVIIGGALSISGALLNRRSAQQAAETSKEVDFTTMSPEARKVLQGLFGSASNLAEGALTTDFTKLREDMVSGARRAGLVNVLNQDVPGLKAAMGKAGAYNSTAYGITVNDAIASADAKAFLAGNAAADSAINSQLTLINPILGLLNIDKGAQKKGIDAVGGGGGGAATDFRTIGRDATNIIGGITSLFNSTSGGPTQLGDPQYR